MADFKTIHSIGVGYSRCAHPRTLVDPISMTPNISLRAATESDWDFVAGVTEECMRIYAERTWGNWLPESRDLYDPYAHKIVIFGEHDAGCISVSEHADFLSLEKLYIGVRYQRHGVGSSLLSDLLKRSDVARKAVRLRVLRVNPAQSFYERFGFRVTHSTVERVFMERLPQKYVMPQVDSAIRTASQDEARFICDQLQAFNASIVGDYSFDPVWLACIENSELIAGLVGEVVFGWFNINVLWVSDKVRRRGVGSSLLRAGERVAVERGASYASLDTFDWQATAFYGRHGYLEFARLEDCPPGHHRVYMKKGIA